MNKRNHYGSKNPNWKGGNVNKICMKCGKEFIDSPSGTKRYCSKTCCNQSPKNYAKGKNHPQWKADSVSYQALHRWIEKKLGKPMICWSCGDSSKTRYEWANISYEYKRSNGIKDWIRLCGKCHRFFDDYLPKGENHKNSKLNNNQVIEIRKEFKSGNISQEKLANRYNICQQTLWSIIHRKTWKHI